MPILAEIPMHRFLSLPHVIIDILMVSIISASSKPPTFLEFRLEI